LRIAADSPKPKAEHALPPRASIISGDIWNCCSAGTEERSRSRLTVGVLAREYFGQRIMGTVFGAATMVSSLGWHSARWRVAGYLTPSMP
jgi:hypothetical protein